VRGIDFKISRFQDWKIEKTCLLRHGAKAWWIEMLENLVGYATAQRRGGLENWKIEKLCPEHPFQVLIS